MYCSKAISTKNDTALWQPYRTKPVMLIVVMPVEYFLRLESVEYEAGMVPVH